MLLKPSGGCLLRLAVATLRAASSPTSQQPNWQAQHLTRRPVDSASLRLPTSLNLISLLSSSTSLSSTSPNDQDACSFAPIISIHTLSIEQNPRQCSYDPSAGFYRLLFVFLDLRLETYGAIIIHRHFPRRFIYCDRSVFTLS